MVVLRTSERLYLAVNQRSKHFTYDIQNLYILIYFLLYIHISSKLAGCTARDLSCLNQAASDKTDVTNRILSSRRMEWWYFHRRASLLLVYLK